LRDVFGDAHGANRLQNRGSSAPQLETTHMTGENISECSWPSLSEPFATALRQAVGFIFQEVEPVGVLAAGTIIRGRPHRSSDLDLYIVHVAPYRRRIQRFFNGVPAEIFINPPSAIRTYFAEEDRDGRRLTAHMLATGVVVFQADPVVTALRAEAGRWLAKETPLSEFERLHTRYAIASRLEDAFDVLGSDDATAAMLLNESVMAMLEYLCRAERGQIPRQKDLLTQVRNLHPAVGARAAEFFQTSQVHERARIATDIADETIGTRGFFEWDSGPGPAPS
jgi:hypothetical protein